MDDLPQWLLTVIIAVIVAVSIIGLFLGWLPPD